MNTVFSLVYTGSCKTATNPINSIKGPFLFQSLSAAQDALLVYIRHRFAETYADLLVEQVESFGVDLSIYFGVSEDYLTSDEAFFMLMSEKEKLNFDVLSRWLKDIDNDEDIIFDFKIEELPTISFIEQAEKADAVEINGNFIRHFNVFPALKIEDVFSTFLDASMVNDDHDDVRYDISLSEAQNATYCTQSKSWTVGSLGSLSVTFIHFK